MLENTGGLLVRKLSENLFSPKLYKPLFLLDQKKRERERGGRDREREREREVSAHLINCLYRLFLSSSVTLSLFLPTSLFAHLSLSSLCLSSSTVRERGREREIEGVRERGREGVRERE